MVRSCQGQIEQKGAILACFWGIFAIILRFSPKSHGFF
nr:MAG TPA: hypothetical protein [Caudoviricetes sp.]